MPAVLEIDGTEYTATLSPAAVEVMEGLTNYGFPHITYGVQVAKLTDLIAFVLGCIHTALPDRIKYLSDNDRKAWLWEKMHLLDGSEQSVEGLTKLRAIAVALMARDSAPAEEGDTPSGDSPNALTPPSDGGQSSAISVTGTSKSATRKPSKKSPSAN